MKIYLPQAADFLHRKLAERSHQLESGVLCNDTRERERRKLEQLIFGKDVAHNSPVILTGHQPIFYPPGILIKDLLADALARGRAGRAVNLVVDTDEQEIALDFPMPDSQGELGWTARKARSVLGGPSGVLHGRELSPTVRADFNRQVHACRDALPQLFHADDVERIAEQLQVLCRAVEEAQTVIEGPIRFREHWIAAQGLQVTTVRATQLVATEAFAYFTRFIFDRQDQFRNEYNQALARYRTDHRIKNPAQPLPDLTAGELPFWIRRGSERTPLRTKDPAELDDALAQGNVLPRAVTLTLFTRLFLCDLFIHGRGGARYDVITDRLLESFFECTGAPFTVASATLQMQPRPEYPLEGRSRDEIQADIRALKFDPTRFLPADHPLKQTKRELIEERQRPDADLRDIHLRIQDINERVRADLGDVSDRLAQELKAWKPAQKNRAVFHDRTLPFFFYDVRPLFEAVAGYATNGRDRS